ncbi:MAG: redoxin domain-containing protein [Candidatus Tectomicrobia bacterium]|uniref:Redoxin domain-containing protein n=1 Tax=Tectimicrobiota bacterium TaxID=2528274 RepID=A0A932I3Q3_UNCTE|nr:redoxin domain-containing protein [Candidatus Tectomicrobia bacterium]
MRRAWPLFQDKKIRVVAVSPAEGAAAEAVCGMLGSPFICLGDPAGKAYDAFGLVQAEVSQLINFRTFSRGLWAMLRGHRHGQTIGDRSRLPGAFIIDGEGTIRWGRRGRDAADHPTAQDLLNAWDGIQRA